MGLPSRCYTSRMARKRKSAPSKAARRIADYTGGYPNKLTTKVLPAFPKRLNIKKRGG